MANYSAIKAAVNAYIKANGKKEITGRILNSVLNATIDSLGKEFQFGGVLTPADDPGQPDQNVAYIGAAGTYPNFDSLVIASGTIGIFMWNGNWSFATIPVGKDYDNDIQSLTHGLQELYENIQELSDDVIHLDGINEEDLSIPDGGKLQFANRVYNAQQPNGMGYVILRKNKTFAEQVTEANTIYEIRYDFDLGGDEVTIPAGCELFFDGGSLSNGNLILSNNVLIQNGVFTDVGILVKRNASIINSIIIRNQPIDNKYYCVLVESEQTQVDDALVIRRCRIENHCPAPSSSSGPAAVYGLAIKIISSVKYHFTIENNYLYSSCSMVVETQGNNAEITGIIRGNRIISDLSLFEMTISMSDKYGEKIISNNTCEGGVIEISPYCSVVNNIILRSGGKAIQLTGTIYDENTSAKIIGNTIYGILVFENIKCSFDIGNNIIYGIIWGNTGLTGTDNKVYNNTIYHTEATPIGSFTNTYALIINSDGCIVSGNDIYTIKALYVPKQSLFINNRLHITKSCIFINNNTTFKNNKIVFDNLYIYYGSYYIIFRQVSGGKDNVISDNTITIGDIDDVLAAHKPIYEYNPVEATNVNISTIKLENNIVKGLSDVVSGTSQERPVLSYYYGKAKMFDTTLGQEIYWYYNDVRAWRTSSGEKALLKKGATADRPTLVAADSGFTFFDTTLGKMIVWNGSAWVNMDGSALS